MRNTKNIESFLQKDKTWEVFNIKSHEDFLNSYLIEGKFHKNVPDVIKKDYKIVESLLFYSYYNYLLIDEAFAKSTRIFESSVDLKLKNLNILKDGFENLGSKLKRLRQHSSEELSEQWDQARKIRNIFAHQKAGNALGIILMRAFKQNINMINSVFLTLEEILLKENTLLILKNKVSHFKKGVYIFEYNDKKYLIWSMIPYSANIVNATEISFWVFHPVYSKLNIKEVSDFPKPFMLALKDVQISNEGMTADVISSSENIKISISNDLRDKEKFDLHNNQMLEVDIDVKEKYWHFLKSDINKELVHFLYESWELF